MKVMTVEGKRKQDTPGTQTFKIKQEMNTSPEEPKHADARHHKPSGLPLPPPPLLPAARLFNAGGIGTNGIGNLRNTNQIYDLRGVWILPALNRESEGVGGGGRRDRKSRFLSRQRGYGAMC